MSKFDILQGPSGDLSRRPLQRHILARIRGRRLQFVWMGMPCSTFSRARRGRRPDLVTEGSRMPMLLRTSEEPWGITGLPAAEKEKVEAANALLQFVFQVARVCVRCKVGFVIENPRTSILWCTDSVAHLMKRRGVRQVHLDFRRYGTPWRKSTTLLTNLRCAEQLALRCGGRKGLCGASGRPHCQLTGRDATGVWWTKRAEPYPARMARAFAAALVADRAHVD